MTGCTRHRQRHKARAGEVIRVTRDAYGRMILVGDGDEIACIPHEGCRLAIEAIAPSADPQVRQLLPLDEVPYIQVRFFGVFRRDLFLLPNGREVKLQDLEGFKLRLMPAEITPPPREEDILRRAEAHEPVAA